MIVLLLLVILIGLGIAIIRGNLYVQEIPEATNETNKQTSTLQETELSVQIEKETSIAATENDVSQEEKTSSNIINDGVTTPTRPYFEETQSTTAPVEIVTEATMVETEPIVVETETITNESLPATAVTEQETQVDADELPAAPRR